MAKLGQFRLGEQVLGSRTLPQPIRPISRHRIPLGTRVRKSLSGNSFPKTGAYTKEITYRYSKGRQMRYQYNVGNIPAGVPYVDIWFYFSSAVHLWQGMTATERAPYNTTANRRGGLSGYNLFIQEYINAQY